MSNRSNKQIEWDDSLGMSMEEFDRAISDSMLIKRVAPGEKVTGKVVAISENAVFIDINAKSEGIVPIEEFIDTNRNLGVKIGDIITATVVYSDDEIRLSYRMRKQDQSLDMLREAFEGQIPVEGRVERTNKGGFDVNLGYASAFCPVSQIDLEYIDNPGLYVGETYHFLITQMDRTGRNIVVSRAKLLEIERQKLVRETLQNLAVGDIVTGKVKRIMDFGVFVDIGGLDALIPVSHLAWERIQSPSDIISLNQEVQGKVLEINPKTQQVSLSIRDTMPSPWETFVGTEIIEGATCLGTVVRFEKFGAFIRLKPGLEGLLHVSDMEWGSKINHPSDRLKIGDTIHVKIIRIDAENHRISLSAVQQAFDIKQDHRNQEPSGFGSLGSYLQKAIDKKKQQSQ